MEHAPDPDPLGLLEKYAILYGVPIVYLLVVKDTLGVTFLFESVFLWMRVGWVCHWILHHGIAPEESEDEQEDDAEAVAARLVELQETNRRIAIRLARVNATLARRRDLVSQLAGLRSALEEKNRGLAQAMSRFKLRVLSLKAQAASRQRRMRDGECDDVEREMQCEQEEDEKCRSDLRRIHQLRSELELLKAEGVSTMEMLDEVDCEDSGGESDDARHDDQGEESEALHGEYELGDVDEDDERHSLDLLERQRRMLRLLAPWWY